MNSILGAIVWVPMTAVLLALLPTAAGAQAPPLLLAWGTYGTGDGQFFDPLGVGIAPDGEVYVADTHNDRIQVFTSDGTYLRKWGNTGSGSGQFRYPYGVAINSSGNVYVVDCGNNRIQVFTRTGTFIRQWGAYGAGVGQFNYPYDLSLDAAGNVYVADCSNSRIQVFTSTGGFITQWGTYGSGEGQFELPEGLAVGPDSNIYVGDGQSRIQVFSGSGTYIRQWATVGTGVTSVTVDNRGNVYTGIYGGGRIAVYREDGTYVTQLEGFLYPGFPAVDANDCLYVPDGHNNQIKKFGPLQATPARTLTWGQVKSRYR